ncbi:hypothetical protein GIB67_028366 [Kingdonia uniflora]|uniref:Cytochrome P450 n=1 Tax=Kingdonia uniflora TaxID=39325 RepID=A0A7J7MI73_9MAGN|nr:hypothetical protein GIB67_028366 [Kingdonia uniflora]
MDDVTDVRVELVYKKVNKAAKRSCPGISYSLQVLHLTLARLLHGFEMTTPLDMPVDMTPHNAGIAMSKATPLDVIFTPRLPSKLYE